MGMWEAASATRYRVFFFFSSRRRHTRLQGDWSSDVCSSDLRRPMSDSTERVDPALAAGNRKQLAGYKAKHFKWEVEGAVATIALNRPERKNRSEERRVGEEGRSRWSPYH